MDKKDNNRNMVKKLLLILCGIILVGTSIYVIALSLFELMIYSVISSSSLFNIVLGLMCLPFVIGIGFFIKEAIKVETVYEFVDMNGNEIDSDLMREQLTVVKSNDKKEVSKYSYVFDNNYKDIEDDEIIDDIPFMEIDSKKRKRYLR